MAEKLRSFAKYERFDTYGKFCRQSADNFTDNLFPIIKTILSNIMAKKLTTFTMDDKEIFFSMFLIHCGQFPRQFAENFMHNCRANNSLNFKQNT